MSEYEIAKKQFELEGRIEILDIAVRELMEKIYPERFKKDKIVREL